MAAPHINDIGARFATKRQIPPAVYTPGTVDGAAIDRLALGMPQSCKMVVNTGAATGSTATANLQDSADGSTGWANYVPPRGVVGDTTIAAAVANTLTEKNVDLAGAKQFVRIEQVTAGGTNIATEAHLTFGGGSKFPQP